MSGVSIGRSDGSFACSPSSSSACVWPRTVRTQHPDSECDSKLLEISHGNLGREERTGWGQIATSWNSVANTGCSTYRSEVLALFMRYQRMGQSGHMYVAMVVGRQSTVFHSHDGSPARLCADTSPAASKMAERCMMCILINAVADSSSRVCVSFVSRSMRCSR